MLPLRVSPGMLGMGRAMFPELVRARARRRGEKGVRNLLCRAPEGPFRQKVPDPFFSRRGQRLLSALRAALGGLDPIPSVTYTLYRQFARTGDRGLFEAPYFARRRRLVAAAAAHFLAPDPRLLDAAQDGLWAICEESTWILPAHERGGLDLFATETAFSLAETIELLRGELAGEVVERVESEIRRRVIAPYLAGAGRRVQPRVPEGQQNLAALALGRVPLGIPFNDGHNNWTGVCASSVGAVLLYLEPDRHRLARGLNLVLGSLGRFLERAFAADGASDEGVAYWHYGLINLVAFAELLRERTAGKVDLLADPKMRRIAAFPLQVRLSPGCYYSHADCPARTGFHPGVLARLARRTGQRGLLGLLSGGLGVGAGMPMLLRDLLWWDGRPRRPPPVSDVLLPAAGIFRLKSGRLVLAGKAGHNAENHNHNDVGSFVLHASGEDLLCDPGAARYCRDYFSPRRYDLFLQAQSRGHSVPVVGGRQQAPGREFRGEVTGFRSRGSPKTAEVEFAGAYPVKALRRLRRRLELSPGGRFAVEDRFEFRGRALPVEEALVTWHPVRIQGSAATVRGESSRLELRIVHPKGGRFRLETCDLATHGGAAARLRRLTVRLPSGHSGGFRMEGVVRPRRRG